MTREEETDVMLFHIVLDSLGGVHFGRKVGEDQQVGGAESIATESVMLGLVEESCASGSMTGSKDHLYLTTAEVDYLTIVKISDLPLVVTHIIGSNGHITGIQIDFRERTYPTHMIAMGMSEHHGDRLGSNLCHNLVQIRYIHTCIYQNSTLITLNEVERFVIESVSVSYPGMLVELAEHHLIILINHFAAKVATVDIGYLRLNHIRHQTKQHGCYKTVSFHHIMVMFMIAFFWILCAKIITKNEMGKKNTYFFCNLLTYSYLCTTFHHNPTDMKRDNEIFELIEKEHQRQLKGMELIASENFVSDQVMEAMGSYLTNKYAEGYPGKRYYGGCQVVDQVEQLAIDRVCKLFGAEYANVQPHSGAQANAAVLLAVLKPGDTFMGMNLDHGGHLSHGSHVNTSGILYNPIGYNLNKETGRVDYDEMEQLALEHKPKLIIGGGSAYSREWDYKRMREIADKVGALLMIDMAHPAGLIAAGLLDNPVKYAHIVTSTTHKTLRGPRGGIILMGKDFDNPWGYTTPKGVVKKMSQLLNSAVFPGQQGGPLEHVIAAKAVAFGEALQPEFKEWAKQVQKNAKVLAEELVKRGFHIVSGGTDNHSMLVDLRSKYPDLTGKVAENALVVADITVNKNMVPFDSRSAFQTSGLRLGTPAITTRGAKEDLMVLIAELIEEVLNDPENEEVIAKVRAKVNDTMKNYPLFAY